MNTTENIIKPSTIGYYQMVKGGAETGSLIPNIKSREYCYFHYMFPNQLSTSALSNKG
jgi:hypothetical protein